jgi:hypothetical protein
VFVELLFSATLIAAPPISSGVEGPQPLVVPPPTLVHPVQQRPAGAIYNPAAEPGIGLRRYGLGATIVGVIVGIGGVIAANTNPCGKDGARGSDCVSDTRNAVAMSMGVASLGVITGGVIAMSIGHAQRRKARQSLENIGRF